MSDNMFDIEGLFKYYSKTILKESKKYPLMESETKLPLPNISQKFNATIFYDKDPALVPSSFQISYNYKIVFNINQIKADYSSTQLSGEKNIDIDDDAIEKMIQKKMKSKTQEVRPKVQTVDTDGFFVDVFKKNIPSYTLTGKLNDLIRAGVIPIENWKVYGITYSTQVDDNLLWRKLETEIKRGKPALASPFGYEISFENTDKSRAKTEQEVKQFATEFSKALEDSIFKDTQYYKITRR